MLFVVSLRELVCLTIASKMYSIQMVCSTIMTLFQNKFVIGNTYIYVCLVVQLAEHFSSMAVAGFRVKING